MMEGGIGLAARGIWHLALLWAGLACVVARGVLTLVRRRGGVERPGWIGSAWPWAAVAGALLLSVFLRPAQPGTYVLLDHGDRLVVLWAGYVLASGLSTRGQDDALAVRVIWGVGGVLAIVAVLQDWGGTSAAAIPLSLRSPLFSLSSLALSVAVGAFLLGVLSEGVRTWGTSGKMEVAHLERCGRRSVKWAAAAATVALLLGSVGGFLAWGAEWSWDPVELWRLSLLLFYALLLHQRSRRMPRSALRAALMLIALAFSGFVLFGAGLAVRELGLPSRYVW